jgi:hypothetical protein
MGGLRGKLGKPGAAAAIKLGVGAIHKNRTKNGVKEELGCSPTNGRARRRGVKCRRRLGCADEANGTSAAHPSVDSAG